MNTVNHNSTNGRRSNLNAMYILLLCIQTLSSFVGGEIPVPPFVNQSSQCPPSCNIITQPCDCYHDGWVDCAKKNLKSMPMTLPKCVRNLEVRQNGITELGKMSSLYFAFLSFACFFSYTVMINQHHVIVFDVKFLLTNLLR